MHSLCRIVLTGLLGGSFLGLSGCRFFPEQLQPHQLQKLNRGSAPSQDPFFSIPDPIPQEWTKPESERTEQGSDFDSGDI